ncbi:MAG: glycosyltransferase [Candidatus Micrarchaeota archaeon]
MRIAIIIVTYNANERLKMHLTQLKNQTKKIDSIIIVNNGTADMKWVNEFDKYSNIEIIEVGANTGPAGGFKIGAKRAYSLGYDYIILADDDALPAENAIEYFYENAAQKIDVVRGFFSNGSLIVTSNHYFMIHRDVFTKIGFYFDPFFLMNEDVEFVERIASLYKIKEDNRIKIYHPRRLTTRSTRWYFSSRNVLVHMTMTNRFFIYLFYFYFYFTRALFLMIFMGNNKFSSSFFVAFTHFLQGKMGNTNPNIDEMYLTQTDPKDFKKNEQYIFIATDLKSIPLPFNDDNLEIFNESIFFGNSIRNSILRSIKEMFLNIIKFMGKNLIIANQFLMAYPPFSILAKNIYFYDETSNKTYFYYKNNPFLSILFSLFIIPINVLVFPFVLCAFLFKQNYYKRLYNEKIAQDHEFCRSCET